MDECQAAFEAALELIQEKCGIPRTRRVRIRELSAEVTVPPEIDKIAKSNPELTYEQRIKAIAESEWAKGWAEGMCNLVAPELTGEEKEKCVERMARILATRVV